MRVIQLINDEGNHVGLYLIYKTNPMYEIETEIKSAFKIAKKKEDVGEIDNLQDYADELLEKKRIVRILAEEVFISEV